MRSTGEPDWFEYRFAVPLTGREPVLGHLRERLRHRAPPGSWIQIAGPHGAGVTRLLEEVRGMLRADGLPEPLCVTPCAGDPLEPLRRALAPLFPARTTLEVERQLAALVALGHDERKVLAAWLHARSTSPSPGPDPALVRALVVATSAGVPVLVDRADVLDPASRAALLPDAAGRGPNVVAGGVETASAPPGAVALALDPLTDAQVELLLKRWLKHGATARRLAAPLAARCEGWPGRVVEAVRTMARAGRLRRERRGVVVVRAPDPWPDGQRSPDAFLEGIQQEDGPAWRVVELAAVQGAPDDARLLSDAAGIRRRLVEALLDEARAAGGSLRATGLFESDEQRAAVAARIEPERRRVLLERLLEAWAARPAHEWLGPRDALLRLRTAVAAAARGPAREALRAVLRHALLPGDLAPWALDALADGARVLAGQPDGAREDAACALDVLWQAGRRRDVADIAAAWQEDAEPTGSLEVLARARAALVQHGPTGARTVLEGALDLLRGDVPRAAVFDGWLLLGRVRRQAGEASSARDALRAAARALPSADLDRQASWHQELAAIARHRQRRRAACGHLGRAAHLLLVAGSPREATGVLAQLGALEIEGGRRQRGAATLVRAARLYGLLGDPALGARASYRVGRVLAAEGAYEGAAEQLEAALESVRLADMDEMRPRLHLALASAHRGRGRLELERLHAERAGACATHALDRLRALATVARADLHAGRASATALLESCAHELAQAGLAEEACGARASLLEAGLRTGEHAAVGHVLPGDPPDDPAARLAVLRLDLATGVEGAPAALAGMARDLGLRADLRAAAWTWLALAHERAGRRSAARLAAVHAGALLHVARRSRANDARLHRVLAAVFRRLDDPGRAAGHRRAARRGVRQLVRAGRDPRERWHLARAFWRPLPGTVPASPPPLDAAG